MELTIACIQMNSGANMAENIASMADLVAKAAAQGAQFIATPENSFLMEESGAARIFYTQSDHPGVKAAADMARTHGVWLLVGSVACYPDEVVDEKKTYNRSLLFNPQGEVAARYDKIHLFDVDVPGDRSYRESDIFLAGNKAVVATMPDLGAMLGLTICYDVRFPQLYRWLAQSGANIIAVPAAFTKVTGEAHWHTLLRARAIENGCFIIASGQTGVHPGSRYTFGHSLIIDPWGKIVADGGEEVGVVLATIDLAEVEKTRARLPSLQHGRDFL